MFFNSWSAVVHSAVIAACGYVAVIVIVRVGGNRTISRMTLFDIIVTVTFGSLLARAILSTQDSLVQFVVGFGVLVILQTVVAKAATRSPAFHRVMTPLPKPLYRDGTFDRREMQRQGVGEAEVLAAIRQAGWREPRDVQEVTLETNGELSVIWRDHGGRTGA